MCFVVYLKHLIGFGTRVCYTNLKKIGNDGSFLGWLENYITNRKQPVVLDGYTSRTVSLDAVLTEGSVLGPFFILTIH